MTEPLSELDEIHAFAITGHISDSILDMEVSLQIATGYGQRMGEIVNALEEAHAQKQKEAIDRFSHNEELTETIRKVEIEAYCALAKRQLKDAKGLYQTLRNRRMELMQAIKTRREEPH